jgi:outer membrane protein assembly factor BamB
MSFSGPAASSPRNRTALVLTTSLLVAFFVLIGVGWLFFVFQDGQLGGATPTATPTPLAATRTPTPDVRATLVADDMLTQIAYSATALARIDPAALTAAALSAESPATSLPAETQPAAPLPAETQLAEPAQPAETLPAETQTAVQLPLISGQTETTPVPTALPSATPTAPVAYLPDVEIPEPQPTAPLTEPTPTLPPAPAPTAAATGFVAQVARLAATVRNADTIVYIGPSTYYSQTNTPLTPNAGIELRGRSLEGDWLYGCCTNSGENFWVRPAYVTIVNNPLPAGFPAGADPNSPQWNPNNPKWLPVYQEPDVVPRPQATQPPPNDYPLARYDPGNTGRLPMLPRPPLRDVWGNLQMAGQSFGSPVAVMGENVIASNQDGQLYSQNRSNGSQRWRYNLNNNGTLAPAIQDGRIYFPYASSRMIVLQDAGNTANQIFDIDLLGLITTSPAFQNDIVFVGVGDNVDAKLVGMKRDNLGERRTFEEPQARIQQPAIGQETVYVAADQLWAVDANWWRAPEIIWNSPDVFNVAAPPVYAYPGQLRSAELYVVDTNGLLHALDAHTGFRLWTYTAGSPQAMLAVNEMTVFLAGSGQLRAVSRQTGMQLWAVAYNDDLAGGPYVTSDRVLVITRNGAVLIYDAASGTTVDAGTSLRMALNGAPAISADWIFAPTAGTLFGYQGTP